MFNKKKLWVLIVVLCILSLNFEAPSVSSVEAKPQYKQNTQAAFDPNIGFTTSLSDAQTMKIMNTLEESLKLLNSKLSADRLGILQHITQISIESAINRSGVKVEKGIFSISLPDIAEGPEWVASIIAHDAYHKELYNRGDYCLSLGIDAEKECIAFQFEVAQAVGLDSRRQNYLSSLYYSPIDYHKTPFTIGGEQLIYEEEYRTNSYINTGIDIKPKDSIMICASGEVRLGLFAGVWGPTGIPEPAYPGATWRYEPRYPHGALMVRVCNSCQSLSDKSWIMVGDQLRFAATNKDFGSLELLLNDKDAGNNVGAFKVRVLVWR